MSYILNALRKSEQERQKNRELSLAVTDQDNQSERSSVIARWLVLLVVINALLLSYVVLTYDKGGTSPSGNSLKTKPKTPVNQPETRRLKVENGEKNTTLVSNTSESIAGLIDRNRQPSTQVSKAKIAQPKTIEKKSPPTLIPEELKTPEVTVSTDEINVPEKTKESAENLSTAESQPGAAKEKPRVPWLSELPLQFRREVPDLDINVYVYAEQPEDRFVMVAMKKYRAGEEIHPGMRLEEIQPDGAVVDFRGRRFKIKRY